jgi:prolyl-tRNA editing enzyme YbaK/EbsC (Cys-tRNA(Pro) deacylase)
MNLSASAQKVQVALDAFGIQLKVVELGESTRTSAEAAHAIGCHVGQIAKSIVFQTAASHRPILVIASGSNRVNETLIAERLGEMIIKADADFVQQHTGFVIGGVPPVGHLEPIQTYIDQDLVQYPEVWSAAGNPHAVFCLTPEELLRITGAEVVKVTG